MTERLCTATLDRANVAVYTVRQPGSLAPGAASGPTSGMASTETLDLPLSGIPPSHEASAVAEAMADRSAARRSKMKGRRSTQKSCREIRCSFAAESRVACSDLFRLQRHTTLRVMQ